MTPSAEGMGYDSDDRPTVTVCSSHGELRG